MQDRTLLRVHGGSPTAEEIAALVVVLTRRLSAGPAPVRVPAPSRWAHSFRPSGRYLRPGTGAWRAAALPRAPH